MQDRRTFLGLAAASLLPIGLEAQTPTPRPPVELARHSLTGLFEGFEVVLVELNIPPGRVAPGPGHRHPGPVLGVRSGLTCLYFRRHHRHKHPKNSGMWISPSKKKGEEKRPLQTD